MDLSDKSALQALVHVSPRALAKVKCVRGSGTRLGTGNMTACSASLFFLFHGLKLSFLDANGVM